MANSWDKEKAVFFDFRYCVDAILSLIDYANVIEKNKSQLQHGSNIFITGFKDRRYPIFLESYLFLEIKSLYDITEKYRREGIVFPKAPDYYKDVLRNFRNKIVAHKDNCGECETLGDWMKLPKPVEKIGTSKIREDALSHIKKCQNIISELSRSI